MSNSNNNNNNNNNINIADDDASEALDSSEQLQRPQDTALHQQRVNAWHPILDPVWVIIALVFLGIILIPVGLKIDSIQSNVEELSVKYDAWTDDGDYTITNNTDDCRIGNNFNMNKTCIVNFTTTRDLLPPILIHFQLTNFHQNHRNYYKSKDAFQLLGQVGTQDPISAEDCQPINKLGNITINPCGLIANTFFNDYFTLLPGSQDVYGQNLTLVEKGIAWQSDLQYSYKQPDGFEYSECPIGECNPSCCNPDDSCRMDINGTKHPFVDYNTDDGKERCYRYKYPEDDTTQYLYETYPDIISPIEGVTNEHFVVWMRIATQPEFRKLYGFIEQPIRKDTTLSFRINNNFVVTKFRGSKTLILSTTSIFGGKNPYLAPVFTYFGVFCLCSAIFFTLKHIFRPRKLADPAYLHYKED